MKGREGLEKRETEGEKNGEGEGTAGGRPGKGDETKSL